MSLKLWQTYLFIFLGLIALGTGIGLTNLFVTFFDLKDIEKSDAYSHYAIPSRLYDIKGRLVTEFFLEKRDLISFHELPQDLIRAVISTEDQCFYEHRGANFLAMFQGIILNPIRGKNARGGSGVTQQLAKLLYTDRARSIQRKLIELWYAFQLEKKHSKEEILELYFNLIYFGHGQHGVQAASHFYFGKPIKDVSLAEASFLAGLPKAPSGYSPINNYKKAQNRHKVVLKSMVKKGYISKELADKTFDEFWSNYDTSFVSATKNIKEDEEANPAPFFTEYVRRQILELYGENLLYSGGLQIHTTLNLDYQKEASKIMEEVLSSEQEFYSSHYAQYRKSLRTSYIDILDLLSISLGIDSFAFGDSRIRSSAKDIIIGEQDLIGLVSLLFGINNAAKSIEILYNAKNLVTQKTESIEGALISIDPKTGYIQSMVGGRKCNVANQFNRATQAKRQTGSVFKPLIFALGLDQKLITASEIFEDKIISYKLPNGKTWTPRNYTGNYLGPMTVRRALSLSVNIITIQIWERLLKQLGYNNIIRKIALFFGEDCTKNFEKRIPNEMATALGTGTASPLSVAQAYSVFVNNGKTVNPISILKVYDRNGKLLDDFQSSHLSKPQHQVISEPTSRLMQSLLNDIVVKGTGALSARRANYEFKTVTGGKTGTSANWSDAWFAGFTEKSASVMWVGFDSSAKSLGRGRASAVVVSMPWFKYMNAIGKLLRPESLSYQNNKKGLRSAFISPYTGLLTQSTDIHGYVELFLPGTAPQTYGQTEAVSKIRTELSQDNSYKVTGESVDLQDNEGIEVTNLPRVSENPYILQENLNDLDLSFNLSSGL